MRPVRAGAEAGLRLARPRSRGARDEIAESLRNPVRMVGWGEDHAAAAHRGAGPSRWLPRPDLPVKSGERAVKPTNAPRAERKSGRSSWRGSAHRFRLVGV